VNLEKGKTLILRLDEIGKVDDTGHRTLFFNLNGQRREISIMDATVKTLVKSIEKAEPTNREHVGALMTGTVLEVFVHPGDVVKKNDVLLATEAMKMEMSVQAPFDGVIKRVLVKSGQAISSNDLLIEINQEK
jgi:pyruvate carboxylase